MVPVRAVVPTKAEVVAPIPEERAGVVTDKKPENIKGW